LRTADSVLCNLSQYT